MKHIYSGDIDSLASIVEKINNGRKYQFFSTNEITHAKLKNKEFQISGILFKGIGRIEEQKNSLSINLKVRLKRLFVLIGLFVLIILSSLIWSENVTINGDSDQTIWKRISFVAVGFIVFIVIPGFVLTQLKNKFKKKVQSLIK